MAISALGLVLAMIGPVQADIMPGTWDTTGSDLMTGTWLETFGPDGPGRPGSTPEAQADDAMQWMMGGIEILAPASGHDNGDGTITYTTDYGNAGDPGMSSLMLGEAPTLWGDALSFTNLAITVEATIDIATREYLGGTFTGTADAVGTLTAVTITINGSLMETGLIPDPPGHEGVVDYMEVTTEREPLMLALDIKPGSCPNPINGKSRGKLPVALLGIEDVHTCMIDLSTLQLARADGIGGYVMPLEGPPGPHTVIEDVAGPFDDEDCACGEVEPDGIDDVSMKFSTPEVFRVLELYDIDNNDRVELVLSGSLHDGTPFFAYDCVILKGRNGHAHGHHKRGWRHSRPRR